MIRIGIISYVVGFDRWVFVDPKSGQSVDLHCGEILKIKVFGQYRSCRLELANDWYVIFTGVSFVLKQSSTYKVRVGF